MKQFLKETFATLWIFLRLCLLGAISIQAFSYLVWLEYFLSTGWLIALSIVLGLLIGAVIEALFEVIDWLWKIMHIVDVKEIIEGNSSLSAEIMVSIACFCALTYNIHSIFRMIIEFNEMNASGNDTFRSIMIVAGVFISIWCLRAPFNILLEHVFDFLEKKKVP